MELAISTMLSQAVLTFIAPETLPTDGLESSDQPVSQSPESSRENEGTAPNELIFTDPDGNPLPPEMQKQLRERFKGNPPPQQGDGIIVRGQRPRGSIQTDAIPERSYNHVDLRAYGANDIEELIDALGPQVRSSFSQEDEPPVLLLNGRRIGAPLEIARIPTEAIERLDVFPEQLASQYGFRNDVKVVNVVTFEQFSSLVGLGNLTLPTEGGTVFGNASADFYKIGGDLRLGLGLNYSRTNALTEAERDILQPSAREKLGRFRTLIPETDNFTVNGTITHPIVNDVTGSLSMRYQRTESEGLSGLLDNELLSNLSDTDDLNVVLGFAGQFDDFFWSSNIRYTRLKEHVLIQTSDAASVFDQTRSQKDVLVANFDLNGSILELPSGFVTTSIDLETSFSDIQSTAFRAVSGSPDDRSRDVGKLSFSLDVPLTNADTSVGRFSTNFRVTVADLSDVGTLRGYTAGLTWIPTRAVSISALISSGELAPTLEQLGNPVVITPNVRTLDFVGEETVDIEFVTGGNPNLRKEDRRVFQTTVNVRPFASTDFNLFATYASTQIDDPIASFPLLTIDSEAAFPERFSRNTSGLLTSIDARPLNFVRSSQDRITWGLNFLRPLGPVPDGLTRGGRVFRDKAAAERAFPDAAVVVAEAGSPLARRSENLNSRFFLNIYHTWYLTDQIVLAPNTNALDLLKGGAVDFLGGRREHQIELDTGIFKRGLGARLSVDWRSSAFLTGAATSGGSTLHFSDFTTVDLNVFVDLAEQFGGVDTPTWLKGMRLTLGASNLFNTRTGVQGEDGQTPIRYQEAYLDPLGRTVSLSLRKAF